MKSRAEITSKCANAYAEARKKDKGTMLDEVVAATGWSRDNSRRTRLYDAPPPAEPAPGLRHHVTDPGGRATRLPRLARPRQDRPRHRRIPRPTTHHGQGQDRAALPLLSALRTARHPPRHPRQSLLNHRYSGIPRCGTTDPLPRDRQEPRPATRAVHLRELADARPRHRPEQPHLDHRFSPRRATADATTPTCAPSPHQTHANQRFPSMHLKRNRNKRTIGVQACQL